MLGSQKALRESGGNTSIWTTFEIPKSPRLLADLSSCNPHSESFRYARLILYYSIIRNSVLKARWLGTTNHCGLARYPYDAHIRGTSNTSADAN
ncbi:hypothetical protein O9K51_08540 [Purpureocillium lavendulum]|uniref:Uncharacterized protein n=1 Tax=Purpureocillium lavendulum TaxID=1247861 RepID=A0AB34FJ53_9HYPO|nr:hypothetical protein O9K51_08540 [Purpureocillium lavendulum]